jgi:hypothetical protein
MGFYHCSSREHPSGLTLTGPAARGDVSVWTRNAEGYDENKVYLFEGDGDPAELLGSSVCSGGDRFLYEVEPVGRLERDHHGNAVWKSVACDAAVVKKCLYRPGLS